MPTISDLSTIPYSGDHRVDALLWNSGASWNYLLPIRTTLYYTFDCSTGSLIDQETSGVLTTFNGTQVAATISILSYISSLTGIAFVQTASGNSADLHFGATNLDGTSVSGLCVTSSNYSFTSGEQLTSYTAEAFVYLDNAEFAGINTSPTAGSDGYEVLLHELGHALGLKHPFEEPYPLPSAEDNTNNSVMSYTPAGAIKSTFQSYDLLALTWIYGGDGLGGSYGYNSTNGPTLTLTPADTTAPTATTFSPADEATGVAVGSNIIVTFSEVVQRGTGNIILKTAAGVTVATYDAATSANLTLSGSTLTLNPSSDLSVGTAYKVEFPAGSIKDLAGNAYAGTTSYNFTTAAGTPTGGTGPVFIEYNTTAFTANDLLSYLVSSSLPTGVQFSAAKLIGVPAQASMFESLNLSSSLKLGKGVLLTSGDGTPPVTSTSTSYGQSQGGLGDAAMTAIALQAFSGAGTTRDASILEFTATVTDASVTTLAIDLIFGSDEYPEYADSSFVDIAAAIVNGVNYGLFSNGSPLSITKANNAFNNVTANQGLPIEYDGMSGRLTVLLPVSQGINQVRLGVADTGDSILDSGLFVSNLRTLSGTVSTGVKLEIVAPVTGGVVSSGSPTQQIAEIFYGSAANDTVIAGAGDDYANSSGGSDYFDMGDGDDYAQGGSGNDTFEGGNGKDILEGGAGKNTFKGSVTHFNGDTINDFDKEDSLLFTGAVLTNSSFVFENSSAAANLSSAVASTSSAATTTTSQTLVAIDTNKDGTVDGSFVLKGSFNAASFSVSATGGNTVMTLNAAPTPTGFTQAKVYLGLSDNFSISNSGTTLYGNTGIDVVTLTAAAAGVVLDQNVDHIRFANASDSYTFMQTGNKINVYDASGSTVLVSVPLQSDADGTLLGFANGTASAKLSAGVMTLGGASLSGVTAGALTPTLSANPAPPSTPSTAKVYLGITDSFTLNSSGSTLYGNTGIDKVTLAAGVSSTVLDQNVDEVVFSSASGNYAFRQTGNKINVYDATGSTLLTSLPVQSDADGTVLTFSNGSASAKLSAGVMTLGQATVSSAAATALLPFGASTVSSAAATTLLPFGASTVSISADGSSSATGADQTYTLALGNYTHTISGFAAGDKLDFPAGNLPTVDNNSFTDGQVDLIYASAGTSLTIRLTGLASATDSLLSSAADFDLVFGAGTVF